MINRRRLLTVISTSMAALLTRRASAADPAPAAAASMATDPDGKTTGRVDVLGGRLRYLSAGDGEPVILLHKLGGRIEEWRRIVPMLATRYRVLAFDLAGHGQSQMHGPPPFVATQESVAAQLMGALDELQIAPPYRFVGSSLGGCVGIVCAALWPHSVAAVVSLGSALGNATTWEAMREAAAKAIADGQFDADDNPLPRDFNYARRVFGVQDVAIHNEQNESRAQAGSWISPASRGVGRFDYLAVLPQLRAPVLLAWGERGAYGRFVDAALAALPGAQKAMIPSSGAFPHEEAPQATAELIVPFLDATARPS